MSKSEVAAQSLFTAASAANAIPVAGQFVSAGLAIAGMFVKIFGGRKAKKRAEAKRKKELKLGAAKSAISSGVQQTGASKGMGQGQANAPIGSTAPVDQPQNPSFSSWGGGSAPSVQPVQQALNNKLGL
jgi:hypothetical protein